MKIIFLTIFVFVLILAIGKTSFAGMLSVSAKGTVRFLPKNVKLTVRIDSHGKTQKSALSKLGAKINMIAKNIKHMKTNYINIVPVNVYDFKSHKMLNRGYDGWETSYVRLKVNKLNKYVIYLLNVKDVQIQNIKYYDASVLKYKIKAIKIAFKKALAKAKPLLDSMNKKIKGIKTIKITDAGTSVYRPFPFAGFKATDALAVPNKIVFAGKSKIVEDIYIKISY